MITLNIDKIKSNEQILDKDPMICAINSYYNYCDCNDFSNLKCPLCGNKCLTHHKTYERHLTYFRNNQRIDIIITITVCKCEHCYKTKAKQKYHALLPEFVLPYIIYEASTIMNALNDYFNKIKVKQILERLEISHKLFYDWLKKFNIYIFYAAVVLSTIVEMKTVISKITFSISTFLMNFYDYYHHPFFLFRLTCVHLCIIP